jgi:pimeloyl-ACP methyl ester carboxylesterase
VLARLGRWDGTPSSRSPHGSIAGGHAVFLSHGWSPGFLASYQQLQAATPNLVTAWTPGLVNGSGETLLQTWVPVAQALQAADPGATIVLFSWVDQSATGDDPLQVRLPQQATEVNGHRFATAIDQALAPTFHPSGGQVHLIGHSFGANVATTAALATAVPPRQLTLLDSPETDLTLLAGAKNDLRYKLPRLDIGRGPGQTFVDNYISYVGIRYGTFPGLDQVVVVQTAPPSGDGPAD